MLVKGATIARQDSAAILSTAFTDKALFNGSVYRLKINADIDYYLFLAHLKAPMFLGQKERSVSNTGIWYLDQDTLLSLRLFKASRHIQIAIGNKIRAAEKLKAAANQKLQKAVSQLNSLFTSVDLQSLTPNKDGGCNYFATFVEPSELGLFHGSQFYSPKRQLARDTVRATNSADRIGNHGCRVRLKAKRRSNKVHIDPANINAESGYWTTGRDDEGGDVALANPGNVLFLRMRPYLNKTTINETDARVSASPEFLIYEFEGIDAFYSTLCLRQPWALAQVAEIATGDRPRVDGEFVDEVVVPWPESRIRDEIGQLYKSSFILHRRADCLVQQAIDEIESATEGSLDSEECMADGRTLASEFELEFPL